MCISVMVKPTRIGAGLAMLMAAAMLAAAAGCVSADVSIVESDKDGRFTARRGEYVYIALPSNPDAGLGWVVTFVDPDILREEEPSVFVARSDMGEDPGVDLFRYRAMIDGETRVRLEYRRDVDGRIETTRTFGVTVVVGNAATR